MGDDTVKITKKGKKKPCKLTNCWEFKTHAQEYMSNTCLVCSSFPHEALVAIN